MSGALIMLGDAMLETIGLNPQGIDWVLEAHWPGRAIFGSSPLYQATGLGDETLTLALAARPHVMGGLDQWGVLKSHGRAQDVIRYIRLNADASGSFMGNVGIKRLSSSERKLAPNGVGYRWEFVVELINLGFLASF
jgi:phage protein U